MSIYIDGRDCCQTGQFSQDVADVALTDVIHIAHLLAHVIEGLEQGFCDFLGSVFMQLELGDKYRS